MTLTEDMLRQVKRSERENEPLGKKQHQDLLFPIMDLQSRLPLISTQSYPTPEYGLDHHHEHRPTREPLRESTGNQQHAHLAALTRFTGFQQHPEAHSTIHPPMPTPPILPTQSLVSPYASVGIPRPQRQPSLQGRRKPFSINPLLLAPEFQPYRKRQAEKDDKSEQKWPEVLEKAFLDGEVPLAPAISHDPPL